MEMSIENIYKWIKKADHMRNTLNDLKINNIDQKLKSNGNIYFIDAINFEDEYLILLCEYYNENNNNQSYFLQLSFDKYKEKFNLN